MTLADLKPGKTAIVDEIMGEKYGEGFAKRLYAMGIFPNKSITVLRKAPLGGPVCTDHLKLRSFYQHCSKQSSPLLAKY
jgi:Fe2+ transport system protein FeoA